MEIAGPALTDGVVTLRPLTSLDVPDFHAGQDEEQQRWFYVPGIASLERIQNFIAETQRDWQGNALRRYFGVCEAASGDLVGGIEVRDRGDRWANISWITFPAYRRRGYAARAARLAYEYAFATFEIDEVRAIIEDANVSSTSVARAAGFMLTGAAESEDYGPEYPGRMLRFVVTRDGNETR